MGHGSDEAKRDHNSQRCFNRTHAKREKTPFKHGSTFAKMSMSKFLVVPAQWNFAIGRKKRQAIWKTFRDRPPWLF